MRTGWTLRPQRWHSTLARAFICLAVATCAVSITACARAQCQSVQPVECPECFAVVVMPDTQVYTWLPLQPQGAAHLDLVTRYICANAAAWTEPSTGKVMPILMTIHLGDLVESGDLTETMAGPLAEWVRMDAAMDNLDNCDPVVPYLVTAGNHDYANFNYEGDSVGYDTYFGTHRWTNAGYGCADPANCSGTAGDWFIGGGDTIVANSRNNVGAGSPGPSFDHPGRHRAGIIRAPNNQRFL
ncbi:MAG: metallophosphoesterase, partial [Deltaproteobacteria bacterium]|nr:metallophosphoesterase [Deltaproteobacteria bacterium]